MLKHEQTYQQEWQLAGFHSEIAYQSAKMERPKRDQLREEIEMYKTNLHTLQTQVSETSQELAGKERKALDQLRVEVDQWRERYNQFLHDSHRLVTTREDAVKLKNQIMKSYDAYMACEEDCQLIIHLHDLVRGDNDYRLSF